MPEPLEFGDSEIGTGEIGTDASSILRAAAGRAML